MRMPEVDKTDIAILGGFLAINLYVLHQVAGKVNISSGATVSPYPLILKGFVTFLSSGPWYLQIGKNLFAIIFIFWLFNKARGPI